MTPNLNRLATEGLRFTQFCCAGAAADPRVAADRPHAHQAGVGHTTIDFWAAGLPRQSEHRVPRSPSCSRSRLPDGHGRQVALDSARRPAGPEHTWPRQRGLITSTARLSARELL